MGIHDSAYAYADYIINLHNMINKYDSAGNLDVKDVADYFILKYERFNQKYPLDIQRLCYLIFLTNVEHYKALIENDVLDKYGSKTFIKGDIYETVGGPAFKDILNPDNYAQTGEPIPYFLRNVPESMYNVSKEEYTGPKLRIMEDNLELLNEYSENIFDITRNISTDNLCKWYLEIMEFNSKNKNGAVDEKNITKKKSIKDIANTPDLYENLNKYGDEDSDASALGFNK